MRRWSWVINGIGFLPCHSQKVQTTEACVYSTSFSNILPQNLYFRALKEARKCWVLSYLTSPYLQQVMCAIASCEISIVNRIFFQDKNQQKCIKPFRDARHLSPAPAPRCGVDLVTHMLAGGTIFFFGSRKKELCVLERCDSWSSTHDQHCNVAKGSRAIYFRIRNKR